MLRYLITTLVLISLAGCGGPLYPERTFTLNPRTGQVTFSSTQEEDLIVGSFTATDNQKTGERSITLGTTTQPAVIYGAKSVGAMEVYVKQQAEYAKILEILGDDVTNDLNAIGGWIGSITARLKASGVPQETISACTADIESLRSQLRTQAELIKSTLTRARGQ